MTAREGATGERLRRALKRWRVQSPKDRAEAIHFFRDEARQSETWAKCDPLDKTRHLADARTLRAAVALLRAAAHPGGNSR